MSIAQALHRPRLDKRRVTGLVLLAVLLGLFLYFNRLPKLDTIRSDLEAAAAPASKCFQGFCVDDDPQSTFLSNWWRFSFSYLKFVWMGMTFAFLVAGLTEVFIFPRSSQRFFGGGLRGALRGLIVGTPFTLCSACIVPVASAFRRKGAGIEATLALAQSSPTLNVPALIMTAFVFTPLLTGTRIALGLAATVLTGPLIASVLARRAGRGLTASSDAPAGSNEGDESFGRVLATGLPEWAKSSAGHLLRLGPLMVAATFITGVVVQWIDPKTVSTYLGDSLTGVAIAATLGILVNVPLIFEVPLVVALVLVGMGTAPAAALLFTASASGPFTFWGLSKVVPVRAVAALGATTWLLGMAGGLTVLLLSNLLPGPPLTALRTDAGMAAPSAVYAGPAKFLDITQAAGIAHVQFKLLPDGSCLLDGGPNGMLAGQFCLPERMSGGAAAADYDNDGYVDLFVTRLDGPNSLFRNRGDGSFEDRTATAGLDAYLLRSNGAAWVDVDNDGDMDLYVTTIADKRFYLFINDGSGRFTEEGVTRGAAVATSELHIGFSIAVGDYDRDGWPDLHINEWGSATLNPGGALSHARLLRNRGRAAPGHFEDVTVQAGVALDNVQSRVVGGETGESVGGAGPWTGPSPKGPFSFASAFVDLDGDGRADLAVASDFGTSRLFWNNGDGTFTDGTLAADIGSDKNGMGSTFGDYDGDGDLDWFVSSVYHDFEACKTSLGCSAWGATGNRLYRNEGGRGFSDATDAAGVRDGDWGWGAAFFDFDNDGDLDLAMVNGMHNSADPSQAQLDYPRLWLNDGKGRMSEISQQVGLTYLDAGKGLLTFDYDCDGDLDLFAVNNGGSPRLYRNDGGSANAWLRVNVIGASTNRLGLGVKLVLIPAPDRPPQVREVGVRSHFLGQSELTEHFGLGSGVVRVHELRITWPVTGKVTVLRDVPANATIAVQEAGEGYRIVQGSGCLPATGP